MTWHKQKSPHVRGSHFNDFDINAMETEVGRLFQRSRSAIRVDLTNDQIFELITPALHRAENARVAKRMSMVYFGFQQDFRLRWSDGVDLKVMLNYPYDIIIPAAPGFVHEGNEELMQRIDKFANRRIEIGVEFGRARALMRHIANNFTMAQIMYLFPQIIILIKNHDDRLYKKLKFDTRPRSVDIDFPLRKMIEEVTLTFTGTMLLAEGNGEAGNLEITGSTRTKVNHDVEMMLPFSVY